MNEPRNAAETSPGAAGPRGLRLVISETHEALSRAAAAEIVAEVRRKPDLLLCLATGASPTRAYEVLGDAARGEPGLFGRLRVLKLDEWGGLDMDDPGTCEEYLREKVLEPLRVDSARYVGFRSDAPEPDAECSRVAAWVASRGPIDISVLGLGADGHLALNVPAAALRPFAHVAALSGQVAGHPMLSRSRRAPTHGFTTGMAEILQSRRVVLIVSGAGKREALARLLERRISPEFPASFLWLHPRASVFSDREAAARLAADPSGSGGDAGSRSPPA